MLHSSWCNNLLFRLDPCSCSIIFLTIEMCYCVVPFIKWIVNFKIRNDYVFQRFLKLLDLSCHSNPSIGNSLVCRVLVHLQTQILIRLLVLISLYPSLNIVFIFNLPLYILPDLFSLSSLAFLPFLSGGHLTAPLGNWLL